MVSTPAFISREELLNGVPARRASMLLFAIESRAAHLALQDRQAAATYLTEQSAAEQERSFLAALSQGRASATLTSIQDLERYAPLWAPLVPVEAGLRAAFAQLLGGKYRFRAADVPALRRALGLDDLAVQEAFLRFYEVPIESIYQPVLTSRERLRWGWAHLRARIEGMPPFWTAFALTLTETVGAGILALPIALAQIGALGGLAVLLVLGLVNCLTLAGLTEAIIHNGNMRYGSHYFGRLVRDYFGAPGELALTLALVVLNLLGLLALVVGVATTLAGATSISAWVWATLLFVAQLYFLSRESIPATAASALVIGGVNILLILILAGMALPHLHPEFLQQAALPGYSGPASAGGVFFSPVMLSVVFGVVLTAYFGHTSAGNAAKVVLRRDPSGRALIWGNIAALGVAAFLYLIWVLAVNGAVPPARLAAEPGTALIPLAEIAGPAVYLLGSVFIVSAMGMASIYVSLGLYNQVREILPHPKNPDSTAVPFPRGGRFWIAAAPTALVFFAVQWLLLAGQGSFTGVLGFLGSLVTPIVSGIFPALLLVASRRKADYPAAGAPDWWGRPAIAGLVSLVFLASLLVHGLFIWTDLPRRGLALGIALGMGGLALWAVSHGAFRPRLVLEFRLESEPVERASFNILIAGKPSPAAISLEYGGGQKTLTASEGVAPDYHALQTARFTLVPAGAQELKIWAHTVSPEGDSTPLAVRALVTSAQRTQAFDLLAEQGTVIVPLGSAPVEVQIQRTTDRG